jgi:hypothetical protein
MIEAYFKLSFKFEEILMALVPFGDMFVQLLVIYLTWTQGSDEQLKRKDCIVSQDLDGRITFTVREFDV